MQNDSVTYVPSTQITRSPLSTQITCVRTTIQQPPKTPSETMTKPKRTGSVALFFRKVYHLAWVRMTELCERLQLPEEGDLRRRIWTCFEHSLMQHTRLMRDRHLDQLLMCAVYVVCKVTKEDRSFQEIMKYYRLQPQAASHVYRSVLVGSRRRKNSGNTSHFEFEERGDLIKFYNKVYVPKIQKFAYKFSLTSHGPESPPLSPLPRLNAGPHSPWRRVSSQHALYVSPLLGASPLQQSPSAHRPLYCSFNKSPLKDFRAINNYVKRSERNQAVKRILQDEGEGEPTKRHCSAADLTLRKLQNVMSERQGGSPPDASSSS